MFFPKNNPGLHPVLKALVEITAKAVLKKAPPKSEIEQVSQGIIWAYEIHHGDDFGNENNYMHVMPFEFISDFIEMVMKDLGRQKIVRNPVTDRPKKHLKDDDYLVSINWDFFNHIGI